MPKKSCRNSVKFRVQMREAVLAVSKLSKSISISLAPKGVRMILLDEKDVIAVTWQCSRIGAREIKIHPLGHLRFCRARSPCLRSSTARSYHNKNAGLVGPADSCSSPCGETTRF